jgi:hypothetical protein
VHTWKCATCNKSSEADSFEKERRKKKERKEKRKYLTHLKMAI